MTFTVEAVKGEDSPAVIRQRREFGEHPFQMPFPHGPARQGKEIEIGAEAIEENRVIGCSRFESGRGDAERGKVQVDPMVIRIAEDVRPVVDFPDESERRTKFVLLFFR